MKTNFIFTFYALCLILCNVLYGFTEHHASLEERHITQFENSADTTTKEHIDTKEVDSAPSEDDTHDINANDNTLSDILEFSPLQANRTEIPLCDEEEVTVDFIEIKHPDITPDTIIMITPESEHSLGVYSYWVEAHAGYFRVFLCPPSEEPWKFSFFIARF